MRNYTCPDCRQMVFFDDLVCTRSGTDLAYRPNTGEVVRLSEFTPCAQREEIGCSFVVEDGEELCASCRLTTVRPPAGDVEATTALAAAEEAKRILLDQCLRLGLDISGVQFELKSGEFEPVITGHADGVVTINVDEAHDVNRTKMRESMGEAYRTLLGHFRHEIGHYLWADLVDGTDRLESCREVFGDDRADYQEALDEHYGSPPPEGWQNSYVSEYATAHPWEDFAETLAHYLHIRDTLETASAFGVSVDGEHSSLDAPAADAPERGEPDDIDSVDQLVRHWLGLSFALNALNRSMGLRPAYPFVLAPPVIDKLRWVHDMVVETA